MTVACLRKKSSLTMRVLGSPGKLKCKFCLGIASEDVFKRTQTAFRRLNPDRFRPGRKAALIQQEIDFISEFVGKNGRPLNICHRHLRSLASIGARNVKHICSALKSVQPESAGLRPTFVQPVNLHANSIEFTNPQLVTTLENWLSDFFDLQYFNPEQVVYVNEKIATDRKSLFRIYLDACSTLQQQTSSFYAFWKLCTARLTIVFGQKQPENPKPSVVPASKKIRHPKKSCRICLSQISQNAFLLASAEFGKLNPERYNGLKRPALNQSEQTHIDQFIGNNGRLIGICYSHLKLYAHVGSKIITNLLKKKQTIFEPEELQPTKKSPLDNYKPKFLRSFKAWLKSMTFETLPNKRVKIPNIFAKGRWQFFVKYKTHLQTSGQQVISYRVFWKWCDDKFSFFFEPKEKPKKSSASTLEYGLRRPKDLESFRVFQDWLVLNFGRAELKSILKVPKELAKNHTTFHKAYLRHLEGLGVENVSYRRFWRWCNNSNVFQFFKQ